MRDMTHSLFSGLSSWWQSWRRKGFSVRPEKRAPDREEELYRERLQETEREYVRQAMETYAKRKL